MWLKLVSGFIQLYATIRATGLNAWMEYSIIMENNETFNCIVYLEIRTVPWWWWLNRHTHTYTYTCDILQNDPCRASCSSGGPFSLSKTFLFPHLRSLSLSFTTHRHLWWYRTNMLGSFLPWAQVSLLACRLLLPRKAWWMHRNGMVIGSNKKRVVGMALMLVCRCFCGWWQASLSSKLDVVGRHGNE